MKGFEVGKIIYNNRNPKPEEALKEFNGEYVCFDSLLAQSDFLICCCAATDETNKIFNKSIYNKMKSNAIFVNISRGSTVDQDDLYDALFNKKIFKAGKINHIDNKDVISYFFIIFYSFGRNNTRTVAIRP